MKLNLTALRTTCGLILAALVLALPVAAQEPRPQPKQDAPQTQSAKNIVETATAAGNFTTLLKAIEAAGLTDTLKSGSYTVFAPTDEAFAKLPAGTLDSLMKDTEKLKKVLLYHVVSGNVTSTEVAKMKSAKTAEGSTVKIKASDGKVWVDKATVTQPDIAASNGVIHVVDTVLMPTQMSASTK